MCTSAPVTGALETFVRLSRGKKPRAVRVAIAVRSGDAEPEAAGRAFDVFTRFVDATRCDRRRVRIGRASTDTHEEDSLLIETWEATFPKMRPDAFGVLARLVRCSVRGARRLEIRELAPEHALVVRGFDMDPEATILEVPFRLAFVATSEPAVRLVLSEPFVPDPAAPLTAALRAWGEVLALGGFPGAEGCLGSVGRLVGMEPAGERELIARLEGVRCGHDAWEALFEVLVPVHDQTSIVELEIHGGGRASSRCDGRAQPRC